jgi:acyl carrier protein
MVPRDFVVLEEFPLTADGEYDVAVLPEPHRQTAPVLGFVEPGKPTEIKIAGWFRQILGADRVGIHDSFFALGGSSLQATVLTSKIFDEFDINLSLSDMFANATVAELSDVVITALGERYGTEKTRKRQRSLKGLGLAIHGRLPLPLRRVIPPGVPCGGSPGDGKRRAPGDTSSPTDTTTDTTSG